MQSYKAQGIILKRSNLGEADRIVTVFSQEFGKIKFVAKGSRRINSKLAGSIEPFYFTSFIISKGKSLDILTSASIKDIPIKDEKNLKLIKTASFFSELVDKMWPERVPNTEIYTLLEEVFASLGKGEDDEIVRLYFESKFYQISGYFPETFVCVRCGHRSEENLHFSPSAGGIVDSGCCAVYGDSRNISTDAAKLWRYASNNSLAEFLNVKIPKDIKRELTNISNCYLTYVTQREFNSDKI